MKDMTIKIKYVGPLRRGIETGVTQFAYDKATECPAALAEELVCRPDFEAANAAARSIALDLIALRDADQAAPDVQEEAPAIEAVSEGDNAE